MKNYFAYTVTADQRRSHIAQLEAELARLDAAESLPLESEWFKDGGVGPEWLALFSENVAESMGVTREGANHLAYYIDHEGGWYDDETRPEYQSGKTLSDTLVARYGGEVNPTTIPAERKEAKRKLAYERRKLREFS